MNIDLLLRTKRKTVALIIEADGRLVVRAPLCTPLKSIHELIAQKADWIQAKQRQAKSHQAEQALKQFVTGESFWFLGHLYPLEVVPRAALPSRATLHLDGKFYLADTERSRASQIFVKWYKTQARVLLTERVEQFAQRFSFTYQRIRISSARTRWGSCSSRGALSFTWRLTMAPRDVVDYVVVHELAHLREKNHSQRFWELVQSILPDYQTRRRWLKDNGRRLEL